MPQNFSPTGSQPIQTETRVFSDLDLSLTPNPISGDITPLTGDAAVIRSVKNLVLTNFYERPFHPEVGSSVIQFLFSNATPMTLQYLRNAIIQVIENFEPRVKLQDVIVQNVNNNKSFEALISFWILNNPLPTTISVLLKRTR